ncbi:glycosyltransferase family 4 protein [Streptomyces sp. CA-106110]|uniref:glycosyltransferase family 4 protein n=1 Tax=Streptomyces sp. CA-106110 TaxID=3240044 RepID=UPI003D94E736
MSTGPDRSRVLLLTSSPLEGGEGADKQLAAAVADGVPGMEFTWFTRWPARGRPRLAHGRRIPVLSRDGVPHVSERLQIAVASSALSRRTDLIHAVLTIGSAFPRFSRLRRHLFGDRPVIHTVPGVMDPRFLERARPLGVTIALSEATAQTLRAAGFGDVRVIPPAVPLDRWPQRPRRTGTPTVLFAGHYDPGGGASEAIMSAAVAARAGARFRLALAMRLRPGQDERSRAAGLRALARREGLSDVDVYGHVDDMPGLLDSSDVLLFPPRALGGKADVPLTVLEALATGRPVILSDLPQFAALSDAILRAPVGDCERAGLLLAELLDQPLRWEALAARGRAVVEERFGAGRFAKQYEQVYRETIGLHSTTGVPEGGST